MCTGAAGVASPLRLRLFALRVAHGEGGGMDGGIRLWMFTSLADRGGLVARRPVDAQVQ